MVIDNACTLKMTSYSLATIFDIGKCSIEELNLSPSIIPLDVLQVTHQNQSDD